MKAAYVSYADYGGPLIHTKEFVRAFREFVPDLLVHCPFLDVEITVGRMERPAFFNRLFSHLPAWSRQLKLEFYQLRKLVREWARRGHYSKLYRQGEIELVVLRQDSYVMGPISAALRAGIPYVLETNGVLSEHSSDRVTRWYERFTLSRAAGVTAVCDPLAEMLVDFGARSEDLLVVPNGVRLEAFDSPDTSCLSSGSPGAADPEAAGGGQRSARSGHAGPGGRGRVG
jgi:glycosyltransferase involved in cell wall biosynthesis